MRKKPGPKKRFPHELHIMIRDDELSGLRDEAERQRQEYEDDTSVSDVVRQCIRQGLHLDD